MWDLGLGVGQASLLLPRKVPVLLTASGILGSSLPSFSLELSPCLCLELPLPLAPLLAGQHPEPPEPVQACVRACQGLSTPCSLLSSGPGQATPPCGKGVLRFLEGEIPPSPPLCLPLPPAPAQEHSEAFLTCGCHLCSQSFLTSPFPFTSPSFPFCS